MAREREKKLAFEVGTSSIPCQFHIDFMREICIFVKTFEKKSYVENI
jgi:hypothetical protein